MDDLTNAYINLSKDISSKMPYGDLLKPGAVVQFKVRKLSSGACVRVEKLNKSFFLILGELTYYWLDNKGNYYSEDTFNELCHTHKYEIIDPGHRVFN